MVTGRPVRFARDWAEVPAGRATQLSMSVVASSWVRTLPLKSGLDQRQSFPGPQAPSFGPEAVTVMAAGAAVAGRAVRRRTARTAAVRNRFACRFVDSCFIVSRFVGGRSVVSRFAVSRFVYRSRMALNPRFRHSL